MGAPTKVLALREGAAATGTLAETGGDTSSGHLVDAMGAEGRLHGVGP